jgi:hypothetical protein
VVRVPLGKRGDVGAGAVPAFRSARSSTRTVRFERWQQPELPAWKVPKHHPLERRPRAPEWTPAGTELAAERDDAAGADIAA